MDKMQEDFEDYMRNIFDYYDALKKEDDGSYIFPHTESDWQIWQASRQAMVVELPATCCRAFLFEIEGANEVGIEHDEYYEVDDILSALNDAGIKWTE